MPLARRAGGAALAAALLAPLPAGPAVAGAGPAPASTDAGSALQRWVEESAAAAWTAAPGNGTGARAGDDAPDPARAAPMRIEVRVGSFAARPGLSACTRIEPFLPPNARLWGPSHIGVRCLEGASWTMMVPVTVSVYGPALVADRPLPGGALAEAGAFRLDEVDLTRTRGSPVVDPGQLDGRTLARPLRAGETLRAEDLRVLQTVAAGDPVRIRLVGPGFTVSAEGFALAGAGEGQPLRVRTGTGKLLVGTVRERVVEVKL